MSDEEIEYAFTGGGDEYLGDEGPAGSVRPLLYHDDLTGTAICGGVMIGPRHYLTAGHCVETMYERLLGEGTYEYYLPEGYPSVSADATD